MKQRTMIQKARKYVSAIVMIAMLITMLPAMPVVAAQEEYPYTLFAASFKGSASSLNGKVSEHVNEQMPVISAKLNGHYFSGNNVKKSFR